MNEKRQVAARGGTEEEERTARFYSRRKMLMSRADWDHSGAPVTRVGSPGESEAAGGATWEKLSPFRIIIHP